MRCEEIKRLIDSGAELDADGIRHIETCPDCRRACEATGYMQQMFAESGRERFALSLAELRQRVEAGPSRRRLGFGRRPRLVTAFAAVAALVLFAVLVPLPYTQIDGYEVVYAGSSGDVNVNLVSAAFAAIGCEDVYIRSDDDDAKLIIAGLPSRTDADQMARVVAQLTGSDEEPAVEPVTKKTSKPLVRRIADSIDDADDSTRVIIIRAEDGALFIEGMDMKRVEQVGETSDTVVIVQLDKILEKMGAASEGINMVIEADTSGIYHILKLKRAVGEQGDDTWTEPADSQEIRIYFRSDDGEKGVIGIQTQELIKEYEIGVKARKKTP
jgi:hypothetical protein